MIDGLTDTGWLNAFFAAPNDLRWSALIDGSASPVLADGIRPWLEMLNDDSGVAPIILPRVRGSDVVGWYATTRGFEGAYALGAEIDAWFGPAYLSVCETVDRSAADTLAEALCSRSGGVIYRFSGSSRASNRFIGER